MKNWLLPLSFCATMLLVSACGGSKQPALTASGLNPENFKTTYNGQPVALYTLKNKAGMEVCITNFGARIVSLMVPSNTGLKDVVLGFDSIADYIHIPSDFGAAIGRYANRINHGRFVLNGDTIQLPINDHGHSLHGGPHGWQYQVYEAMPVDNSTIKMIRHSPDGDANYPGNVTATVTYTLTEDNCLHITYEAMTDKTTIINMTNHSYFNLSGDPSKPVTDEILHLDADYFTPVDSTFMTTGEIISVHDTPMDFTVPKPIGQDINRTDYAQIRYANGYDHNYVLNTNCDITRPAAKLTSPVSGLSMEVYTDQPGLQVYTGNFLDGTVKGKNGIVYKKHAAICLEAQHYPDSPNKPEWPSTVLEPGKVYHAECIYKFIN
jgi:aldose 1-epimerase